MLNAGIQGDVRLYESVASDLFAGKLPYRDRVLEYPPCAIPIFVLPHLFGEGNYAWAFMLVVFTADWCVKQLLFATGSKYTTIRLLLCLTCYCLAMPGIRYFFLQRYDIFPSLLVLGAIMLFCSKYFFLSGLTIALGVGIKLYPIVFGPVLLVAAWRQQGCNRFLAGLVVGILPLMILGVFLPWWRFAEFQSSRGLQVESLYASVLWPMNLLGWVHLDWTWTKAWYELHGGAPTKVLPWARGLFVAATLVSIGFSTWVAARVRLMSLPQLARLLLIPLVGFVVFNPVLSPQYLIWLLPLAALAILEGNYCVAGIALAAEITPMFYPSGAYGTGLSGYQALALLTRNLLLLSTWICLIWTRWDLPMTQESAI